MISPGAGHAAEAPAGASARHDAVRRMLYIHVPFCWSKCAYCDFASFPGREAEHERYFSVLKSEMQAAERRWGRLRLSSIYVGGGTPTSVPQRFLTDALEEACRLFAVDPDAEITVEANPGTVSFGLLRALAAAGVNRVSFGAQAFQERLLGILGRIHSPEDIVAAVEAARSAGISRLSVDCMYALPDQTMPEWEETLRRAAALDVEHVSCYSLIPEPGTPLGEKLLRGEVKECGEETTLAMQKLAAEILGQAGLCRYEISNYARPGRESRHNMGYWRRQDYLGLGCAAHSLMDGVRFRNAETLEGYQAGQWGLDAEALSPEEEVEEAVLLETRTVSGVDLTAFRARYGVDFAVRFAPGIRLLEEEGLAELRGSRFRLTDRGLDVQNAAVLTLLTAEGSPNS